MNVTVDICGEGQNWTKPLQTQTCSTTDLSGGVIVFKAVGTTGSQQFIKIEEVEISINAPQTTPLVKCLSVKTPPGGVLQIQPGTGVTVRFDKLNKSDVAVTTRDQADIDAMRKLLDKIKHIDVENLDF